MHGDQDAAPITILLAEEDAGVREVARRILAQKDYRVLVASSGLRALEIASSHPGAIDLLLTGLDLPMMSGVELARRMREREPGIWVVYMSGYPDDVIDQQGSLDAPLITKPFQAAELLRLVREVCQG
jgi:two-component system cell cycle sensor histidine kinase/response regulator CckA